MPGAGVLLCGVHTLLVSHWYVDSQAAVKITTGAFAELKRDPPSAGPRRCGA